MIFGLETIAIMLIIYIDIKINEIDWHKFVLLILNMNISTFHNIKEKFSLANAWN